MMKIEIIFDKDQLNLMIDTLNFYIADLGMTLQDDHRDYALQKKFKRACELRELIEKNLEEIS